MQKTVKTKDFSGIAGFLTIKKFKNGELIWQSEPLPNKVVSGAGGYGRNLLMRQLAGDTTYPIEITTASVGDGTTAPVDGDTALENSLVANISVSNMSVANNVLTVDVFVADGDLADDTYSEFGLFCTGRLFARILISPSYTKASGEDTLFSYTLTSTG